MPPRATGQEKVLSFPRILAAAFSPLYIVSRKKKIHHHVLLLLVAFHYTVDTVVANFLSLLEGQLPTLRR